MDPKGRMHLEPRKAQDCRLEASDVSLLSLACLLDFS